MYVKIFNVEKLDIKLIKENKKKKEITCKATH